MSGSMQNRASGVLFGLSAGILWGFEPLSIHFLGDVDTLKIVAHRASWSLVLLFTMITWQQQISLESQIFFKKKLLISFIITTCFLSGNWIIYLYAVQSDHVVSAALGSFIYPICTVLLGIAVLSERLDRWAWLAVCCIAFGVLVKASLISSVP